MRKFQRGARHVIVTALLVLTLATLHQDAYGAEAGQEFISSTYTLENGGRMNCHYRRGNGSALILVPGTWGGFWRFEAMIEHLPADMPVAVVELTWQGGNVPPSVDITMEQLGDEVLAAVAFLEIDEFVISGHSIGGMIAVEIAGRDVPGLVGAIPMEGWTHHTVVQTAFDGVVSANLTPEEDAQRLANRQRGRAHLTEAQCDAIARIWRTWNGYECLERATVPVLALWGDRGKPRANLKALQIPERDTIEVAWLADTSHAMLLEAPAEVARLVTAFMSRIR